MAKVENLEAPKGWLIDPHNKWAIHFDFKKVSNENIAADFTIDMWGVVPKGKPMKSLLHGPQLSCCQVRTLI